MTDGDARDHRPGDAATASFYRDIEYAAAPVRLAAYRTPDDTDLDTLANYFWNIALSRDLYFALSALEVSMRNSIDHALAIHVGHPDWYHRIPLLHREANAVTRARETITRSNRAVTPGRMIAELSFGFWTSLLSAGYGSEAWSTDDADLVKVAFPGLGAERQHRRFVHGRFDAIRQLRNRTSHLEPIWQGVVLKGGQPMTLGTLYADTLDAIAWSSPSLRDAVAALDRFPETLATGWEAQRAQIVALVGNRPDL